MVVPGDLMTVHLSDTQIRAYRERSLAAAEMLSFSEHLGDCETCRTRLYSADQVSNAVRGIRRELRADAMVHLTYEEIASCADRTLAAGEREQVEVHARECATCAADLAEIRGLRVELEHANRPQVGAWWRAVLGWRAGLVLAAACAVLVIAIVRVPSRRNSATRHVSPQQPAGTRIHDGSRQFTLLAGGGISGLEALAESDRAFIERALAGQPLERTAALQDLTASGGMLLGAPAQPAQGRLIEPVGAVVGSQHPSFRWQPIAAARYRVTIFDAAYDEVASSGWITATEWEVPKALRRGARYSWQIAVRQNGAEFTVPVPPAPEARFRVLGEAEEAEISRARNQFGGSHLVLGMLYARAGLLDQAEQEIHALRDQNPGSAQIASLAAAIERERGLTTEPRPSQ
jgi:hypothetical protein